MANSLIIVESPAKVKTIKKFLGKNYTVDATMGHLIDMPKSSLGVDGQLTLIVRARPSAGI